MASDGAQFCPGCGNQIAGNLQQTVAAAPHAGGFGATGYAPAQAYSTASRAPYVISIILGVLLLGVTATLIIVLLGGGNKSAIKSGMGPGDTVKTVFDLGLKMVDKTKDGSIGKSDLEAAYDTAVDVLPVDKLRSRLREEMDRSGGIKSVEIEKEDVNGDRATVYFRVNSNNGRTERDRVNMIREGGKWKFDIDDMR